MEAALCGGVLKTRVTHQATAAFSSGQAGFYAAGKAAVEVIVVRSVLSIWGGQFGRAFSSMLALPRGWRLGKASAAFAT